MKKKLAFFTGLVIAASVIAQSATNSPAPVAPRFRVATNVVTAIQPITLTTSQLDALIQGMESNGIASDVSVTSSNLLSLIVVRHQVRTNVFFTVSVRTK